MNEIPKLYAIAKQITLAAGFPYTDPRTGETTQPKKMKNNKIPKFILLDQIHVDISIPATMPAKERQQLLKIIRSKGFDKAIIDVMVAITSPVKSVIRVAVTR